MFGSIGGGATGGTLTGVTLSENLTETLNTLTLTNTSSTTQTARYVASTNFDAGDTANATDGTALDNALPNDSNDSAATILNTGVLSFSANQVYTSSSFPLPKTLTEATGTITGTTASYAGTGNFDLQYSTESGFTVIGGGNNISNSQATVTAGTATVVYTYTTAPTGTPEPGTFVLLGGALLALGSLRTRKKA